VIEKVVSLDHSEREAAVLAGIRNARRFDTDDALNRIEEIYVRVVRDHEALT
jgi:hypothetical protein